jgi:DNA-binding SARP family transcriptional activator
MTEQLSVHERRAVWFQLLGPIEGYAEGSENPLDLGQGNEQRLLVALLAAERKAVSRDRLITAVWDGRPPEDPLDAFYHLVSRTRRRLRRVGLDDMFVTRGSTYLLDVPPEQVDLHCFHELTARARGHVGHDDQLAGALFQEALGLCRGEPLGDLKGTWVDAYRHTLKEELHVAGISMYELALRLDKAREVVPALGTLFRDRPGDESVAWLYMHALYRSGRQGDALAVFREIKEHLDETLAAETLKALADLHERMLRNDPGLMSEEAVAIPFGRSAGEPRPAGPPEDERTEDAAEDEPEAAGSSEERWQQVTITAQNSQFFGGPVNVENGFNLYGS